MVMPDEKGTARTGTGRPDAAGDQTLRKLLLEKYEPIAVIGAGLRFPGGNDTLEGFEEFLRAGRSGVRPLPADRWDADRFRPDEPGQAGRIHTAAGGFLDRIDEFDAQFFGVSPKEARYVDPQQRLLLETAWEALENADIDPAALRHGNGGVYVGASSIDYALETESVPYEKLDGFLATGITTYPMSGRLSYFLGWRGPSLSVDTACASSLTALHLAVDGLRRGECDIALVGGVNLIHHPRTLVMFSGGNMLAADGRCKTFDEAADGYGRAEGCGVLVLKRFSAAKQDGDRMLALVRGTAIGQDGASAGLTVPNGPAQERVIRAALANAALAPADIGYVEAHGTGTPLGDPIELGSINAVFGEGRTDPLLVGSLKSNLGHMEPAAGIGGVLKVVLQLRAGTVFPHLYDTPTTRVPWDRYALRVPTECVPWPGGPRRAVVNGFGFAGAIGVAVLEQAPPERAEPKPRSADPQVFTLSARGRRALAGQLERYRARIAEDPDIDLAALCQTATLGRSHFNHRVGDVVHDREELTALLDRAAERLGSGAQLTGDARKVAYLFAGAGPQHPGMGAVLYRQFPTFAEHVDECDRLFAEHLGRSIKDIMFGRTDDPSELHQIRYTQPALFTLEYALAQLWMSWGLRPAALIGHSTGEVVAATVAGVFSLADGVRLTEARSRLMHESTAAGGMAAIGAPADEIAALVGEYPDLGIAAINSPGQCVISGARTSLAEAGERLAALGYKVTTLDVSIAAHSPLMDELIEPLRAVLSGLRFGQPRLPVVSNVTGKIATADELRSVGYWLRHLRQPVDFAAGMRAIERRGRHVFVELGPSGTMTSMAAQCVDAADHWWLTSLHPDDADGTTIRRALADAYTAGLDPDWHAVYSGQEWRRVALPTYAFDRQRYWLPGAAAGAGAAVAGTHPLLGRPVNVTSGGPGRHEFSTVISAQQPAYLADHTAAGQAFFPASGYLELLLALQDAVHGDTRRAVLDLTFHRPLWLPEGERIRLVTRLVSQPDGTGAVTIDAESAGECHTCATAVLGRSDGGATALPAPGRLGTEPDHVLGAEEIYAAYEEVGLDYGAELRRTVKVAVHGRDLAVGTVRGVPAGPAEFLPPVLGDAATHALAGLLPKSRDHRAVRYGRFRLFKKPRGEELHAVVRRAAADPAGLTFDVALFEADTPVFELLGMQMVQLEPAAVADRRPAPTTTPGQLRELSGAARRTALQELIRTEVAAVLQIDDPATIDPYTRFVQLGLNSLGAVELKNGIARALGLDLAGSVALDHPSAELLAEYLARVLDVSQPQ